MTLADSDDGKARAAAGELFDRIFAEFPEDELQVAMAHTDKARWLADRGEIHAAIEHYREGIRMEDALSGGGLDWGGDLALAELLVECDQDLNEARAMLTRATNGGLAFKSQRWRWLITDARLEAKQGRVEEARGSAVAALGLLDDDRPDFPRHPDLGQFRMDRRTLREMRRLAKT